MKAMSKQQIADCAGVSVRTLMEWCKPHAAELKRLGLRPNAKVLPPASSSSWPTPSPSTCDIILDDNWDNLRTKFF